MNKQAILQKMFVYMIYHFLPEDGSQVNIPLDGIDEDFDITINVVPEDEVIEVKRKLNMNENVEVQTTEDEVEMLTPEEAKEVAEKRKKKEESDNETPSE